MGILQIVSDRCCRLEDATGWHSYIYLPLAAANLPNIINGLPTSYAHYSLLSRPRAVEINVRPVSNQTDQETHIRVLLPMFVTTEVIKHYVKVSGYIFIHPNLVTQ